MTVSEFFTKLNSGATWSAGVSFKRAASLPLERYAVHASYAEAEAYASTNAVAYPGQILAVVETTGTSIYYIDQNMALQPVGVIPAGDGKTISVSDDGVISLYGIDGSLEEAKSYQPVYRNGTLTWVELSSTTVEGLQTLIEGLRTDVDAINAKIGTVEENKTVVQMITEAQEAATYDDTALSGRVTAIENDYLKTADKTALQSEISTAKAEAISEAVAAVVGEGTSADFDTLKEIADWILSDTTGAASLVTRISAIESDYLKTADKTALQGEIDALETLVGALPEEAVSTNVVDYIQEAINGLKIGDYAKASELTALAERVTTLEEKVAALETVGAEKNVINSVDEAEFTVDYTRKLSVKEIAMDKITGLPAALEQKVSVQAGYRMITDAEGEKLEKLVLSEDGTVEVSGTIAAGNVDGLESWITTRAATLKGLSENNLTDALKTKIESSQANVIEIVKVNGVAVEVSAEDKSVNIPMATAAALGVVKGTDAENGIAVADDGTMSVNSVNVNKLVQTEGDSIVLDGGNSAE
jgi:polyhydroxyalkanoate synthesis regulator phasin